MGKYTVKITEGDPIKNFFENSSTFYLHCDQALISPLPENSKGTLRIEKPRPRFRRFLAILTKVGKIFGGLKNKGPGSLIREFTVDCHSLRL